MNEFVSTIVNYSSILYALEIKANEAHQSAQRHGYNKRMEGHQQIREYRTIGFKITRQSGKTKALVNWIVDHPNQCLAIFKDGLLLRSASANYASLVKDPTRVIPGMDASAVRRAIDSGTTGVCEEFQKQVKYILVDDADILFSYCGLKHKPFNQWVYDTFGQDVLVIHLG